jgi:hypothetical protein
MYIFAFLLIWIVFAGANPLGVSYGLKAKRVDQAKIEYLESEIKLHKELNKKQKQTIIALQTKNQKILETLEK